MKLESFLNQRGVDFERHHHAKAYTAQELAQQERVSGYIVAKPVIVRGAGGFTMCVLSAPRRLDLTRVAKVLDEPKVRLATEAEMAELFADCELGAEPPVGTLFGLRTLMDAPLRNDEFLVMQSGSHTEAIRMRRDDWEGLCEPVVASISSD